MIVKNAYKEAVMQNFSVISHIRPELYDDEFRILAAAIKIRHIGKFKCSGVFDVIVSTHAGRATQKSIRDYSKTRSCLHRVVLYKIAAILLTRTQVDHCIRAQMTNL